MMAPQLVRVLRCKRCKGRGWYNAKNKAGWIVSEVCRDCHGRGIIKRRGAA